MSNNLASKAISGLKWGSASTVANAVMQIGYTSAMARLLAPEAFGLVAFSSVILRFGSYFAHLGLSQAIIQKEELSTANIRAAFTSSALLGVFFTVLIWFLAPYAIYISDNADVVPIVRVMAFSLLINGLSSTAFSLAERHMQFKALSIVETLSYVVAYLGVGILLAFLDYGVWSLVYATLMQAGLVAAGAYAISRHNVLPLVKWEAYKPLFSYGSKMSVISFLEFLSQDLATILISKFLGAYKLGIYDRAHRLVNLPMYMLTRTISRVIFPSFSQLQSDIKKLSEVYLSSITLLAAVVIPTCMGIIVAAPEIVYVVLGNQWGESIPILQVLSMAIPLSFITMFAGIVCDAKAVLKSKIVLTSTFIVVISGLFFLLRPYGLVGFALAIFIGELVRMAFYQVIMKRVLHISYGCQLQVYIPGLINGLVIAAVVYLLSWALRSLELPLLVILLCQMTTGAVLFFVMTLLFPHKLLRPQIGMVLSKAGLNPQPSSYYGKVLSRYKENMYKETQHVVNK